MLFGERIAKGAPRQVGDARSLVNDEQLYASLLDLAERIGVMVVPGQGGQDLFLNPRP